MPPIWRAAGTYIVYFVAVGASFPYLPVHYRALGLDLDTIGFLAALSAATQLVAAPAGGGGDGFVGCCLGSAGGRGRGGGEEGGGGGGCRRGGGGLGPRRAERAGPAGPVELVLPSAPYSPDVASFTPAEELQTWEIT